eukprot:563321-Prymnesium_polylepis.1
MLSNLPKKGSIPASMLPTLLETKLKTEGRHTKRDWIGIAVAWPSLRSDSYERSATILQARTTSHADVRFHEQFPAPPIYIHLHTLFVRTSPPNANRH